MHHFQTETLNIFTQFKHNFKDRQYALIEHNIGQDKGEPLYIMADCLIRWAKAFKKHNDDLLCRDWYSLEQFKSIASGILALGNCQGIIALEKNLRDSKDNSVLDHLIIKACELAGITKEDL